MAKQKRRITDSKQESVESRSINNAEEQSQLFDEMDSVVLTSTNDGTTDTKNIRTEWEKAPSKIY